MRFWKIIYRRKRRTLPHRVQPHYQKHKDAARALILAKLREFNEHYRVSYGKVAIRNQRTRWGSCSKKGNLNFNYRLVFLPEVLLDYVIVHELCHLIEFNHSPRFWRHVARICPQYQGHRRALRGMAPIKWG